MLQCIFPMVPTLQSAREKMETSNVKIINISYWNNVFIFIAWIEEESIKSVNYGVSLETLFTILYPFIRRNRSLVFTAPLIAPIFSYSDNISFPEIIRQFSIVQFRGMSLLDRALGLKIRFIKTLRFFAVWITVKISDSNLQNATS